MANGLSHFNAKTTFLSRTKSNSTRPSLRHGLTTVVAMAQTQHYWASIEADIETYLKKAIPIRPPESVFEPMHHLTFAAPKTTAPSLCIAACELVGGDRNQAMAAAAAVHLIHATAYIHEHLPLTDRPRPKPRPTSQYNFSPNIELLTGDGFIPFGLELLAKSMGQAQSNPDKILKVIIEITRATGSQGMVNGQFHELELDQLDQNDYEIIEYVAKKKEGELHACGAACGAILGGGDEKVIEKLRNFGLYAGMVKGMFGKNKLGMEEKIEKLKELAVKELESLKGNYKTEFISGLIELEPSLSTNY